jgi:hypothetical protein
VTSLSWVTPAQRTQLDELYEVMGDWEVWLPDELDGRVEGWEGMDPETLVARLDALIPSLVLPSSDDIVELAAGMSDKIERFALDDPEVRDLVSELDQEELEALVEEALAGRNR